MSGPRERPASPNEQATLCPYCGHLSSNPKRCRVCAGWFDPLSRQATQNTMGPWFVRDESQPFLPGCSYETMCRQVQRGKISRASIVRGPTTMQFWVLATRAPGIAHLLGECHSCHAIVSPEDAGCARCGARFSQEGDRQRLGLSPVHLLPGHASPEQIALQSQASTERNLEVKSDNTQPVSEPEPEAELDAEPHVETVSRRRVKLGKPVAGLSIVLLGGAAVWLGVERGVFDLPASIDPPSESQVTGAPVVDMAPASAETASTPEPPIAATGEAEGAGERDFLSLLRVGDVGGARELMGTWEEMPEEIGETLDERAARDRILDFFGR